MTTIKKYNPYTGKHWEVAEPDPSLGLPKTAIIVIEDGVQKIVHRSYAASLETQGSIIINDPSIFQYDYAAPAGY